MSEKDLFSKVDLVKDSKLCLYFDKNSDFKLEIKNLSRRTTYFFLYVILDTLIKDNIIDKKFLLEMINECF